MDQQIGRIEFENKHLPQIDGLLGDGIILTALKNNPPAKEDWASETRPTDDLSRFLDLVRDSVDSQAKRKNYTDNGADGENKLLSVTRAMGINVQHGLGEIVYKAMEYLKNPREVLLIKIAGWAFIVWKGEHGSGK